MQYNTLDIPIKIKYWYIVHLMDYVSIQLFPVYFINKVAAKRALHKNVPFRKMGKYLIMSGKKLKQYELKYLIRLGPLPKFTKYEYPKPTNQMTRLEKRNFRTIFRRRLRRMGMLIPKKHKINIKENVKHARLKVNKQKVANSPYSEARVFQLDRKPKHYYYILLRKTRSKKNKVALECKVVKVNIKTGEFKKILLNIYNSDVITPYLLSELYKLLKIKGNEYYQPIKRYCNKKGLKVSKAKQKEVL
jgi:hypothetical protein